jgi:hypothetical protein
MTAGFHEHLSLEPGVWESGSEYPSGIGLGKNTQKNRVEVIERRARLDRIGIPVFHVREIPVTRANAQLCEVDWDSAASHEALYYALKSTRIV